MLEGQGFSTLYTCKLNGKPLGNSDVAAHKYLLDDSLILEVNFIDSQFI